MNHLIQLCISRKKNMMNLQVDFSILHGRGLHRIYINIRVTENLKTKFCSRNLMFEKILFSEIKH